MTSSPTAESAAALREAADGFFLAAEHGRSDVIKALADHNDGRIDLSQIVDAATGRSPLHVAVAHHKTDALRVLLAAGFPPDVGSAQANGKTRTAYALAVETQAHDLVFVFHQFAVQQVAMDNAQGVAQLLAAGVPLRVTDSATTGNTLLHWAVTCRALAVCELLLERDEASALVNHTNAEGATPLHIACRDDKLDFVRLLLTHGADPRCSGTGGFCKDKTPAELVTSTEIRELLARHEERLLEAQAKAERGISDADTAGEALDSSASLTEADAIAMARRKHSQQLEEKDLLIRQLKSTIETLVVEAQEIRKLGEERTVLDYIRKLREEKDIVRRQLEDAEDHIRIQQQQIQELKRQIRSMEAQPPPPPRPPLPPPQRPSPATDTAAEPAEKSPLSDTAPAPAASPAEEAPAEAPAVAPTDSIGRVTERNRSLPPLRIDTTPPRSRRSTPPRSASGTWSDVWSVLVGNGLQADDVDADGEVIMTV